MAVEDPLYAEPWRAEAACRDADVSLFFPEKTGRPQDAKAKIRAAKAICAGCDVRSDCLRFALDHHENFGVFGGLTPTERRPKNRGSHQRGRCRFCGEGFEYTGRLYCSPGCRAEGQAAARVALRLPPR